MVKANKIKNVQLKFDKIFLQRFTRKTVQGGGVDCHVTFILFTVRARLKQVFRGDLVLSTEVCCIDGCMWKNPVLDSVFLFNREVLDSFREKI